MLTSRARPTNCTTCASTHTCIWPHAVCCRHSYDAGRGPPHPQSTPFSSSLFVPRVSLHVAREGVRQQHTTMLWHLSYPPSHLTYMLASRTADGAAAHLVRTSPPGVGGWHPPTHTPTHPHQCKPPLAPAYGSGWSSPACRTLACTPWTLSTCTAARLRVFMGQGYASDVSQLGLAVGNPT